MSKRQVAVALGYDSDTMPAPKVLAKGGGVIADKIIALAKEQGIPIQSNEALVSSLQQLDLGVIIPEELYEAVVELLVFMMQLEKSRM